MLGAAHSYMLNQAEIGMSCALGTGGDMVVNLVRQFAPADIRERVLAKFESGEWAGETIQSFTERTGGSDLAELETTATPDGDAWRLNGFKWFASNANGAGVGRARQARRRARQRSRASRRSSCSRERRDGTRNGIRIRRLKDKLGTKAVASAEVEFVDAEAFLLSGQAQRRGGRRRRQGPRPHDGDDQRRAARHRDDGPRLRPARARRGHLLRPGPRRRSASRSPTSRSCSASSPR